MTVKSLAIVASLAAVAAFAGTARASTTDCTGDQAWNTIAFNADYGLKPYLIGLGSTSWRGKERLAAAALTAPCGGGAALKAYTDQQRFYRLLRAFPQNPTRAQWRARFRPLIAAAVAADADFLPLVSGPARTPIVADKAWLVAAQSTPFGRSL